MPSSHASSDAFSHLPDRELDVISVGAALMDHLVEVDDGVLDAFSLTAGMMALVEAPIVAAITAVTGEGRQVSGGAEANTAVGVASFGGNAAFVGAVGTDAAGAIYEADLAAAAVRPELDFVNIAPGSDQATGASLIIVTPDAQRTMLTSLGVAPLLDHNRVSDELLASSKIVYFNAYALDYPGSEDLVDRIVTGARASGTMIAFSLADSFCVERHFNEINKLLVGKVDLLFANEAEAIALTKANDIDHAVRALVKTGPPAIVTRGAEGAVAISPDGVTPVAAVPVADVVDTTGAGDLFAAGVLFGIARGYSLKRATELGALSAAEIVSHLGARPIESLRDLGEKAGLLQ